MSRSKALLLGGPFDWRTVLVREEEHEVFVALPERVDLSASVDPYEPVMADLRVARYRREAPLYFGGDITGYVFRWMETR